ncbi:winged helix-turn-helix domain-containing protein [Metallosphaera cuprina]|uniref:Regulatory protein, ArsR n=1 Tax=Metallosphaera cuprina (strain Ar-4) TaxID=1006006 RepID=F4FYX3_METCR|nr:helix-turn-helix domain-containing protein [Metallosphaera cuprina]AEB94362.1 regulatory protein, ArsR [Metallosphaera cuprina Ar-4]
MESLTGTRRKIYYYLMKQRGPVPLRRIQRELDLSSPSLALYHLKKLEENGLVKETEEGYIVAKIVLEDYIRVKKFPYTKISLLRFLLCRLYNFALGNQLHKSLLSDSFLLNSYSHSC